MTPLFALWGLCSQVLTRIFSGWWGDYLCRSPHRAEELTSGYSRQTSDFDSNGLLISLKDEEKVEIDVTAR